jgi:hypothetical protein
LDIQHLAGNRQKAYAYAPDKSRHYFVQMRACQTMPDDETFTFTTVALDAPIEEIISHPGVRVNCGLCREVIMNEREVPRGAQTFPDEQRTHVPHVAKPTPTCATKILGRRFPPSQGHASLRGFHYPPRPIGDSYFKVIVTFVLK